MSRAQFTVCRGQTVINVKCKVENEKLLVGYAHTQ